MSHGASPAFTALERALARVSARVRLLRALRAMAFYAMLGGIASALAGVLVATGALDPLDRARVQALSVLLALWGFVLGWMRAPSLLSTALLVDRTHPFGGRLAAGVELAGRAGGGEMERLAIADALARSRAIEPARALPLARPAHARGAVLAALAALVAASLAPPTIVEAIASVPAPPTLRPLSVHRDDLAALRDVVGALPERERSPELDAEIAAINELIEALSREELDRTEALRRLGEIAEGLREGRAGTLAATVEALAPMARPLARSRLSEPLAEALASHDLDAAASEMERLAERLEREPPSEAELARLREAMAAAAEAMDPETLRREREALEEQRDRLLHREEEERASSEAERDARSAERERELERLRRDIDERREREEELESLRRELDEMMREREAEGGESESESSAMERAAEDLRRYADEAAGESERESLAREVEAMRELVRRMREGGSGEAGENGEGSESEREGSGESGGSRMDRFVLRARGEGEEGEGEGLPIGTPGSGGEEGEGETEGMAGSGGAGEREEGASGPGAGEGEEGEGEGAGAGEMLVLGRGEDRLEIPGLGGPGSGDERGPGSGEGESESEGEGAGTGAGRGTSDDPTGRSGEHTTVRITGEEGAGPTRSEVIRTSAARGFASRDYRDVYGDYRRHADEALEEEEIPPGYRFYVERYFQLIRPRE